MPKKNYADENDIYQCNFYQRDFLHEPLTLHIMKEMEVVPLNPEPYIDENYVETSRKRPLQVVNGTKRRMLVIPEKNPSFKAYRDEFVLFQKSSHYQPQGEDHFSKLSDEIILQIFQWLPKTTLIKCAEVCKRWKNLSYDESLWSRYDYGKKYVPSGVLETLLQRGVSVLRLAMSEIKSPVFLDSEFANRQRLSRLQYLDLSMASISSEALADLLAVCNRLKKLSLEACTLNEDCCKFIAQNKTLEVLNMCMCSGLTSTGLYEIATNCVKLKEWNLAWTDLDTTCMKAFLPFLTHSLLRLNISGHRTSFDDGDLRTVVRQCPNLTELDISDCHLLTAVSFVPLIKKCSRLEHLHISRAYNIPSEYNRYLKNLRNFRKLEIFRTLTDEALAELRECLSEIKINTQPFSTIARPTVGIKRTSIWGLKVRDS